MASFTKIDHALARHALVLLVFGLIFYSAVNGYIYFGNKFFSSPTPELLWQELKLAMILFNFAYGALFIMVMGYIVYTANFALGAPSAGSLRYRALEFAQRRKNMLSLALGAYLTTYFVSMYFTFDFQREKIITSALATRATDSEMSLLIAFAVVGLLIIALLLWALNLALGRVSLLLQFTGVFAAVAILSLIYAQITAEVFLPIAGAPRAWFDNPLFLVEITPEWRARVAENLPTFSPYADPANFQSLPDGSPFGSLFAFYLDTALGLMFLDIPQTYDLTLTPARATHDNFMLASFILSYKVFVAYLFVPLAFRVLRPILPRAI